MPSSRPSSRLLRVTALALVPLAGAALAIQTKPSRSASQPTPISGCVEVFRHEPAVLFDVTGATLTENVRRQLTVYNDGTALYSEVGGTSSAAPESAGGFTQTGTSISTFVSPQAVRELMGDLEDAGAFELCDFEFPVSDTPLRTVTLLDGTRAHSFSYFAAVDGYGLVEAILGEFVAAEF